ncbi:MAG TPA: hypothetical protein VM778_05950 [Gemmatimonadota bacterium]|nr:hypothetical protein [Gemmatimonadota bacterium]
MCNGRRALTALTAIAALGAVACDDTAGPVQGVQVAVAFSGTAGAAAAPSASGSLLGTRDVTLAGTNGTLVIEELRIIVAEFELERLNAGDCEEEDDACEKFEAPPAFVNVPLDGGQTVAVTAVVAPDTYDELEFEIEDLDDDEEDPVEARRIEELLVEIRAEFPDWPRDASMLIVGTFTPTDGEPVPFRVYFEAEVEIELDLVPPVTIAEDDSGATFTVTLNPSLWFVRGDGTVMNLAAFDYDATGTLVEFEFEMENGFTEIEFDD